MALFTKLAYLALSALAGPIIASQVPLEAGAVPQGNSTASSIDTSFFTHQNIFLGPNNRPFNNFAALMSEGKRYAEFFGLKTIDSKKNFGMPKEDMYYILTEVNKLVASPRFDHDPATWKQMPVRLTDAALKLASERAAALGRTPEDPKQKADFEYFVKLKAIEEWFATRFRYDDEIATGRVPRVDFREAMSSSDPRGVCGDLSWGIVHFATLALVDGVYKIEGANKASNGVDISYTHSWNAATLPSGAIAFFDPTRKHFTIELGVRNRRGLTFSPFGLCIEEWATGFFCTYFYSATVIVGKKEGGDIIPLSLTTSKSEVDYFTRQKFDDWSKLSIPRSFKDASSFFYFLFSRNE